MSKTLFIVNPNAGSGRGLRAWNQIEPHLSELASDYTIALTGHPDDVAVAVAAATDEGVERVISIGGDGTSNVVVNALMQHKSSQPYFSVVFGSIPAGTGRDFARSNGIPLKPLDAARYILNDAQPRPVDVGYVEYDRHRRYFINISSAGISNDVVQRFERATKRPWSFFASIINSLLYYEPEAMRIELDGESWYEGRAYIVAVCNNISFAQGIKAAPDAVLDDGLFDIIVAEDTSKLDIIRILALAYLGKHIGHPKVHYRTARDVHVMSMTGKPIGMDFDGEGSLGGLDIHYSVMARELQVLM